MRNIFLYSLCIFQDKKHPENSDVHHHGGDILWKTVSVPSLTFPIGVNPLPIQFSPAFLIPAHAARRASPHPGLQDPCVAPHCRADHGQMPREAKRRKKCSPCIIQKKPVDSKNFECSLTFNFQERTIIRAF